MTGAAIVSIGNELISGHVNNTNATFIADTLKNLGIPTRLIITVGDEAGRIGAVLNSLASEIGLVMITGGLGPTHDDLTVAALAEYFKTHLRFVPEIAENIAARFRKRGLVMPETNLKQAYIPQNAVILENPVGSAPGLKIEHGGRIFYVMPGVPAEMRAMLTKVIVPQLKAFNHKSFLTKFIHVTNLPESQVYSLMQDWIAAHPRIEVAFLPQAAHIDIELTTDEPQEIACIEKYVEYLSNLLGDNVYGYDGETLEAIIGGLLLKKNLTLAVAESCTGGLIASRITDIPGSSEYFMAGVIAYSNIIKINVLGVERGIIGKFGAVSAETAGQMAEGVRRLSGCDIGLSTTGIAGPAGGSPEKPVGLLWIGLSDKNGTQTFSFNFAGDRQSNKIRFSQAALNQLRLLLLKQN